MNNLPEIKSGPEISELWFGIMGIIKLSALLFIFAGIFVFSAAYMAGAEVPASLKQNYAELDKNEKIMSIVKTDTTLRTLLLTMIKKKAG